MNQRGLFNGVVRDVKDRRVKLNQGSCSFSQQVDTFLCPLGTLVASETEEEIFRILDVPWQEPHERIRG